MTPEQIRECVDEILATKTRPPIEECFNVSPIVPRNAWLSALALACHFMESVPPAEPHPAHAPVLGGEG